MNQPIPTPLLADVRQLIVIARQRVVSAVNAELTSLYWQIGRRIGTDLLGGQRAEYGKQVVAELARQLTTDFGRGWSEPQLRHCVRLAEVFADAQILSTVQRELSWSHLKALIYIEDPLKRDFYTELCKLEHWSVRQLQERINSLLYERSVLNYCRFRKPTFEWLTTLPCCLPAKPYRPSCTSPLNWRAASCNTTPQIRRTAKNDQNHGIYRP